MAMRLDHGTDELEEVHGINVTPFIDVMLVLLIIFMVAAPLATVDIAVDLPSSNAEPQQKPDKPIYLTLKPDLTLAIGDSPIARDQLASALDIRSKTAITATSASRRTTCAEPSRVSGKSLKSCWRNLRPCRCWLPKSSATDRSAASPGNCRHAASRPRSCIARERSRAAPGLFGRGRSR